MIFSVPVRPSAVCGFVAALIPAVLPACARSPNPPPPETRVEPVVDTLHGVAIVDPYRWLEDQESAEVWDWIAAQNAHADSVIGRPALLDTLVMRLRELSGPPRASNPRRAGDWEYFTLRKEGEEVASIRRRRAPAENSPVDPAGDYETVIDPLAIRPDGTTSVAIEAFSPDNRLMIYTVRDGGPDEIEVRVHDLEQRKDLPDRLPPALYASISFDRRGRGIYYVHRSRQDGPRFRYHLLGTELAQDSVIFGAGIGPTAFINVSVVGDGRWRVFTIGHGWARNEVYIQDLRNNGPISPVAADIEAHFNTQFIGDRLWMRTDLDAPKGRIVSVDPAQPARENWKEIIPEGDAVLDAFTEIDGKLYVTYVRDVSHQIRVYTMDGQPAGEVEVPAYSSATIRGAGRGKASLTINSFTQPQITYEIDLATGQRVVTDTPRIPFDTTGIVVRQVWYTSRDGTRAPMYLVHRRGLTPTGDHPALMSAYGGFAVNRMPGFDRNAAVWVERGGVYAQPTLRGGNEYGEMWHRGGMLGNKQNVFADFIAAAQWLVDSMYTNPQRFAIRGSSNGGLLMGSVITQRPDLFRAAFIGNPDLDMVRFWTWTQANNMPALLEYGDGSKPEQFEFVRRYSPYQNVRDGTRYPAVLLSTGHLDTRVPPLQARKLAARLQAATRSGLPVLLRYDARSGHAGGRTFSGAMESSALELVFLLHNVGAGAPALR